jgi:hypothetical protein
MLFYSMKTTNLFLAASMLAILSGCATSPTMLREPVGPDPFLKGTADSDGSLQVFTATEEEDDVGFVDPYPQRTDYSIYSWSGKLLQHVQYRGHFDETPRVVRLKPGMYRISALAAVGLGDWISLPVVVDAGRTTSVHLNGHWKPPADSPGSALVYSPSGRPIGWRAASLPNG